MEQMQIKDGRTEGLSIWKKYGWLALAFVVPVVVMWIVFAYNGIFPFGDRQILVVDSWHQYYPFLVDLREKLASGDSLFYTWNNGMGTNFLALAAYYCASPLNLLTLLLPAEYLRVSFALLVTIKMGLAGLFCAIALRGAFRRNDPSLTIFGSCYGLCAFFMGYYWNIMWLDTVALLPLVALGVLSILREGRFRLYVISLALALICNYLIALYVCIFTFFLFFVLAIGRKTPLRLFVKRLVQIGAYTLLAFSLAAFLLIPTVIELGYTYSASSSFPKWGLHESFADILGNLAAFGGPTDTEGLPNIYCGLACILLGALYAGSRKIPRRQKLCALFLLVLLLVSMNVKVIEYMWNGFHSTNMLPYRFSFLVSFVLIAMAFQAVPELLELSRRHLNLLLYAALALLIFCWITHGVVLTAVNEALLLVYIGAAFALRGKKRAQAAVLCVLVVGELTASAFIGVKEVRTSAYANYPSKQEEVTALLDTIAEADGGFYRLESVPRQTLNDPSLLGYRGISTFSSAANVNVTNVMRSYGFSAAPAGNRYYNDYHPTPVASAFTGLKYFIRKQGEVEDTVYLREMAASGGSTVYENTAALPIGFMTAPAMANGVSDDKNPFVRQNVLFSAATGSGEEVFDLVDVIHVGHQNLHVIRSALGNYTYELEDKSAGGHMKYNYEMPRSGLLYGYVSCNDASNVTVQCGERTAKYTVVAHRAYVFCAGYFEQGELVSFRWDVGSDVKDGSKMNIFVGMLDETVFEAGMATLADETLQVEQFSSDSLRGTIHVQEEGYFYTSIPYEAGWTLYVDGEETQITPYQDAFVALEGLEPGEHTIELKFVPEGFRLGAAISLSGLAVFTGAALVSFIRRRRKARKPAEEGQAQPKAG